MYSPSLGCFLSRDPLIEGQPEVLYDNNWFGDWLTAMKNQYAYRGNNPITRTDPSGLQDCDALCKSAQQQKLNKTGTKGRSDALAAIVCAPCGEFQCGCPFDINLVGLSIMTNECPDIWTCLFAHEFGHLTQTRNI